MWQNCKNIEKGMDIKMSRKFLNENFLLSNEVSQKLFHQYAENMPIIDYHCHINPQEIAQNRRFDNITQLWLGGDHYKWRQMRSNGVAEEFITGDADDLSKFIKWAQTLEKALGNPLYHWSHLELKRYFGFDGHLCSKNAKEVYDLCNKKLLNMGVIDIIKMSNVEVIGTTDDPVDDLHWHKTIEENDRIDVKVVPTFRPDKAMNIELSDFCDYIITLEEVSKIKITGFCELMSAIISRMDYFEKHGCRASDHALNYIMYSPVDKAEIERIFSDKMNGITPTPHEVECFKTAFMTAVAAQYQKRGWAMQLHYGCKRNNNTDMLKRLGPDAGFDCIDNYSPSSKMADFFNHLKTNDALPKTIIYSLNPNDDAAIGSVIGCFQDNSEIRGKIQHGSAWWFNDHKAGMINQLTSLANLGLLGNFIGMLTDSRSFLSYTRHEYFRRILCELIGSWACNGEIPQDYELLEKIIKDISYLNAKEYFGF